MLGPHGFGSKVELQQQVEAKLVITAQGLTPKLLETLRTFDNQVRHVVYIEDPLRQASFLDICLRVVWYSSAVLQTMYNPLNIF